MSVSRRLVLAVAGLCFLWTSTGCTTTKRRSIEDEVNRKASGVQQSGGQRVAGFTLADGTYHKYDSHLYLIGADSLAFRSPKYRKGVAEFVVTKSDTMRTEQRFARKDVVEVRVVQTAVAATVFILLPVAMLMALAVAAVVDDGESGGYSGTSTTTSCPFLFAWDGAGYVFDGEPYGGATMSSLQRTDYSELEHLRAEAGAYHLLIRNEVDETQHTDALHLLVADHPAGTRAVMDREGVVHSFGKLVGLGAASDEAGNDLSAWLREKDEVGWNPDLAAFAAMDSLPDTRNHITLEFPRPVGVERAHLVANVGTGQWGSYMLRVMLSLRGNRVQEFYDAVNANPEYQRQLLQWNDREDLLVLDVEVQVKDHWEKRGELHGGGPYLSELRAIPLDLTGLEGDTVRLRLNPPIGFWRFDSFHLGLDETAAEVTPVPIAVATDNLGADVRASLAAEDGSYLDQPTNEEWAELTFTAPPAPGDRERTIFAVTSGWYGIHLYADGPPDSVALRRLTFEPGYAVRRAMAEYADFVRTGRLGYVRPELATP